MILLMLELPMNSQLIATMIAIGYLSRILWSTTSTISQMDQICQWEVLLGDKHGVAKIKR